MNKVAVVDPSSRSMSQRVNHSSSCSGVAPLVAGVLPMPLVVATPPRIMRPPSWKRCANFRCASDTPPADQPRPRRASARAAAALAASLSRCRYLQMLPFLQRPATKSQQMAASSNAACCSVGPPAGTTAQAAVEAAASTAVPGLNMGRRRLLASTGAASATHASASSSSYSSSSAKRWPELPDLPPESFFNLAAARCKVFKSSVRSEDPYCSHGGAAAGCRGRARVEAAAGPAAVLPPLDEDRLATPTERARAPIGRETTARRAAASRCAARVAEDSEEPLADETGAGDIRATLVGPPPSACPAAARLFSFEATSFASRPTLAGITRGPAAAARAATRTVSAACRSLGGGGPAGGAGFAPRELPASAAREPIGTRFADVAVVAVVAAALAPAARRSRTFAPPRVRARCRPPRSRPSVAPAADEAAAAALPSAFEEAAGPDERQGGGGSAVALEAAAAAARAEAEATEAQDRAGGAASATAASPTAALGVAPLEPLALAPRAPLAPLRALLATLAAAGLDDDDDDDEAAALPRATSPAKSSSMAWSALSSAGAPVACLTPACRAPMTLLPEPSCGFDHGGDAAELVAEPLSA
mmetsp:Transcript_95743/g.310219  ORF Transcript_95743/g.310219 Transcript_95743/m.310219 type:complete len:592 (+) Transcript_95743:1955-3730(+)